MGMIRIRRGTVKRIIVQRNNIALIDVFYDGKEETAINYNFLSGSVEVDDEVYINTSSNYLMLGTGGYNFVVINETRGQTIDLDGPGHIMKLRYTPYQVKCLCTSEEDSPYFSNVNSFENLGGMAVITGELHSMLVPTACCLKFLRENIKIAYIMTDGGSLPIDFSFSVNQMKSMGIIQWTITSGNAFGGDFEAVNIYDALAIAKSVLNSHVAIITMGPGITGTGTKYGFSGIEQGNIVDCINTLKGTPVVIPRVSFKDSRKRHYGISHHTITVLSEIANSRANVIFPGIEEGKLDYINRQIDKYGIRNKHNIRFLDWPDAFKVLDSCKIPMKTMGRCLHDDLDFFLTCGSAAYYVNELLEGVSF